MKKTIEILTISTKEIEVDEKMETLRIPEKTSGIMWVNYKPDCEAEPQGFREKELSVCLLPNGKSIAYDKNDTIGGYRVIDLLKAASWTQETR